MKFSIFFVLAIFASVGALAEDTYNEWDEPEELKAHWICTAIPPQRPWRVTTVTAYGVRYEVEELTLERCNRTVILKNCILTGCRRDRRLDVGELEE